MHHTFRYRPENRLGEVILDCEGAADIEGDEILALYLNGVRLDAPSPIDEAVTDWICEHHPEFFESVDEKLAVRG